MSERYIYDKVYMLTKLFKKMLCSSNLGGKYKLCITISIL